MRYGGTGTYVCYSFENRGLEVQARLVVKGEQKMGNPRVLIVEGEVMISDYLSVSLQEKGFDVIGTALKFDAAKSFAIADRIL